MAHAPDFRPSGYYMCTKSWSDGDVHKLFSAYETNEPYVYWEHSLTDLELQSKSLILRRWWQNSWKVVQSTHLALHDVAVWRLANYQTLFSQ